MYFRTPAVHHCIRATRPQVLPPRAPGHSRMPAPVRRRARSFECMEGKRFGCTADPVESTYPSLQEKRASTLPAQRFILSFRPSARMMYTTGEAYENPNGELG